MIDARIVSICSVEDIPVAKPIVQMLIQAKTAMQGSFSLPCHAELQ
jgi:hypothetical protein